jgi:anti-sigma B factor antagonist
MFTANQDIHPDGTTVCHLTGELDAFTAPRLRQAFADVTPSPRLLLDLSKVSFLDSAGLGALVGGVRRTRELGSEVMVACDRPQLVRVFQHTGFDRIVTVATTPQEAACFADWPTLPHPEFGEESRRQPAMS